MECWSQQPVVHINCANSSGHTNTMWSRRVSNGRGSFSWSAASAGLGLRSSSYSFAGSSTCFRSPFVTVRGATGVFSRDELGDQWKRNYTDSQKGVVRTFKELVLDAANGSSIQFFRDLAVPDPLLVEKQGMDLIHDPLYNKGTGFPYAERDRLNIRGLVPPRLYTIEVRLRIFAK